MTRDLTSSTDYWVVNWILIAMDEQVRTLMGGGWSHCSLMSPLIVILMMEDLWLHHIWSTNPRTFSCKIWIWISCHQISAAACSSILVFNRRNTCLWWLSITPSIIHSILNLYMRVSIFLWNSEWIQWAACDLSLVNYPSGVMHLLISCCLRHIILNYTIIIGR